MEKIKETLKKMIQKAIEIEHYDTIDSTNLRAKQWAKEGALDGSIVFSKEQTMGKGRRGKTWSSPKGEGIWMSMILRPNIPVQKAPMLTLVAGLSMCMAIKEVTDLETKIKWPNDIIVNGKKVCGILTEMQTKNAALEYVVVGLGVNVNMEEFPEELPYATSLRIQGEKVYEQEEIVIMFLKYFHTHYALFIRKGFFAIKEDYKKNCITLHSSVKVMEQNDSYETYIIDIDDEGALISKDSNGRVKKIMAGEVSIRGIYGYV